MISHPIHAVLLVIILSFSVAVFGGVSELKSLLKFWIITGIMIIIINPLVSTQGETVLYRTSLPVLGRIRITAESLAFAGAMVLRLFSMVLSIKLFGLSIDRDDFFGYLSRYMNKLVLTMSMTVNMIHRLRVETQRVREVMEMRGLDLKSGGFMRRIKAHYPLIKVVLISSLEGSVNRAEALYSRGYGKGKRSFYREIKMENKDRVHLVALCMYACVLAWGSFKGWLGFSYFPSLAQQSDFSSLYFIAHGLSLTILVEATRRCSAWKFSV
jgi:energy-coupling factor transport system permease protein